MSGCPQKTPPDRRNSRRIHRDVWETIRALALWRLRAGNSIREITLSSIGKRTVKVV